MISTVKKGSSLLIKSHLQLPMWVLLSGSILVTRRIFSLNSLEEVADPVVLERGIFAIIMVIITGLSLTGKRRLLKASCFARWKSFIKELEER
jgi:hypothetical protein